MRLITYYQNSAESLIVEVNDVYCFIITNTMCICYNSFGDI